MIRTLAITPSYETVTGLSLEEIRMEDYAWIWADFSNPTPEEARLLERYFHFHPLAVEDCLHILQRPKLDYYEQTKFLSCMHFSRIRCRRWRWICFWALRLWSPTTSRSYPKWMMPGNG